MGPPRLEDMFIRDDDASGEGARGCARRRVPSVLTVLGKCWCGWGGEVVYFVLSALTLLRNVIVGGARRSVAGAEWMYCIYQLWGPLIDIGLGLDESHALLKFYGLVSVMGGHIGYVCQRCQSIFVSLPWRASVIFAFAFKKIYAKLRLENFESEKELKHSHPEACVWSTQRLSNYERVDAQGAHNTGLLYYTTIARLSVQAV